MGYLFPFDVSCLHTESDVEQKFLYPLLTEILGYVKEEIWTKNYLEPTDIDKGAGKKRGYYPDYLLYLGGIPVIVVEAKDPSVSAEEGLREARHYAVEVNKKYGTDLNPVRWVVSSNGIKVLFSPWDSEVDIHQFNVNELLPSSRALESMIANLSRDLLHKHALEIRRAVNPISRKRPLSLIGGPARQSETLAPNSFSSELITLLRRYFDPDNTRYSREVLERAYCSSTEITQYNSVLEALLKERLPHQEAFESLVTTKSKANQFDQALKTAITQKKDIPDPLILLVGGVGSGKSMFLTRYFDFLISEDIKKNLICVTIDFNSASESLDGIESWLCQEFVAQLEAQNDKSFLDYENLHRYFAPDIAKLERGPLKPLRDANPVGYATKLSEYLTEWFNDPQRLAFGIIRFFSKDKDIPVIVIFDNVDRRDREQQLKVFQTVQWFRSQTKCLSILTLRDETYDAHRDEPPLDAFLKPFAFRITAPRFITVVKKRLELAIEYLLSNSEKKLRYELENGISIEYPATKLGQYLVTIYASIFHQGRQIRLVLEALSGRNTRKALEMFTEILTSGYLSDQTIFSITEGSSTHIQEWLIIRVLMRTRHRYFSSEFGYVTNILELPEASPTANNFLIGEILTLMIKNRKNAAAYKIEGYMPVSAVTVAMSRLGYTKEDVFWALERLLSRELICADHQRTKGIHDYDYVKITASGYFHMRFFCNRTEYLANIPFDTLINNDEVATTISRFNEDSKEHRRKRLSCFRQYLHEQHAAFVTAFPELAERLNVPSLLDHSYQQAIHVLMNGMPPGTINQVQQMLFEEGD